VFQDDSDAQAKLKSLREGFVGWAGLGGSVFQWHPGLDIGFAFVPNLMHWYDFHNARGGRLQAQVLKCVLQIRKEEGRG